MIKKIFLSLLISISFFMGITYLYAQEENLTEGEDKSKEVVESTETEQSTPAVTTSNVTQESNETTVTTNSDSVSSSEGNVTTVNHNDDVDQIVNDTSPNDSLGQTILNNSVTTDNQNTTNNDVEDNDDYNVHFKYLNYKLTIKGKGSITLSKLLRKININANINDIEYIRSSNYSVIAIRQIDNDYLISSLKAFNTNETITIKTKDGNIYKINLTDPATAPVHDKNLYDNEDGTYILELTVTGDADNIPQESGDVDFILVYDVSQSMTNNVSGGRNSRADQAEDIVHDFLTNLAEYQNDDKSNIRVSLVTFSRSATRVQNWSTDVTGMANRFDDDGTDGRVNFTYNDYPANYGTNWDYALQLALGLVNTSREGVPTFVVLFTDGAPTAHGENPSNTDNPQTASIDDLRGHYRYATANSYTIAQAVTNKGGTFYGIYAYGDEADLLDDLMYYSVNGQHRGNNINNVIGRTQTAPNYYNAANTSAVQEAIDSIFDKIVQAMGISTVVINDGTTNNVETSTGSISELLEVDTDSYEYWISIPVVNNTFTRVDRNDNTITYTVNCSNNSCTVTWGSKSVTVQGSISGGEFKYKWTTKNDLYDYDAPAATFTNGAVNWNLTPVGTLLDGVTYSVTFRVYPSQTTLDYVADIKNNPGESGAWSTLDPEIQKYIDVNGNLKTNTTATLTFTDTRTGESGDATYINPDPVETNAVEAIAVTKVWDNDIDDRRHDPVTLTVTRDGVDKYTVDLSDDNDWTDSVFVSIGIIDKDGNVLSGAEGHDFTFTEPENLSYHWELDVPVVHPMLINGVVTMLIKVDEKHPAPDGADTYVINGSTYYVDEAAVALTATNDRRSRLFLTKLVTGDNVPEDTTFPFTINVVNSKAPETEPENDPNHDSDYWVWISIFDEDGNGINEGVTGATSYGGGYWYAPSGTNIIVPVKVGYSILINNLPTGTTYTITEGTLPEGFKYNKTELSIEGDGTDSTFSGARTTTGTIESTNTVYTVEYTNEYTLIDVTVNKYWDDNGDQDGVRPEELTLTLNGAPEGTTIPTPDITVSRDGNTWTYTWKEMPKYDSEGNTINYTITEGTVPTGYECITTTVNAGGTITNTHKTSKVSVHGTKTWVDGGSTNRPSVTIVLLKKVTNSETGEVSYVEVDRQTLSSNNTYSFDNLPEKDKGVVIEYSVQELTLGNNYISKMTKVSNYEYNFTNTLVKSIKVTKTWKDGDNKNNTRPTSITVVLMNGDKEVESHEITADDWSYTFTNLPVFDGNTEIKYSVKEVKVDGYKTTIDGFNITNTLVRDIKVTKTWADGDNKNNTRPTSIIVVLMNGDKEVESHEITADDWSYTFTNLPVFDGNTEIKYSVKEVEVDGYKTTIDGFDITNTLLTSISVKKVWDDKENYEGLRPDSVTINLYANGESVDSVELNEENEWKYTWSVLAYDEDGEAIEYTIDEEKVEGYDTAILGNAEEGFTVINTHSGTGGDVPENPDTGDNVLTYIAMMIISLIGLLTFSIKFVKNN